MDKEAVKKSFGWSKLLVLLILVVVAWLAWFVFFDYDDCRSKECFNDNLRGCDRARFVGGDEMIFEYMIEGKSGGECEVAVTLLRGELKSADSLKLENEVMNCFLPLGAIVVPESDIDVCHGMLKEGLQDLIIKKLHTYLVQNLGRLNLELTDIPSI